MSKTKKLSKSMQAALSIAKRDGVVIAGRSEHKGKVEFASPKTIQGLASRGHLTLGTSPDGLVMGTLKEAKDTPAPETVPAPSPDRNSPLWAAKGLVRDLLRSRLTAYTAEVDITLDLLGALIEQDMGIAESETARLREAVEHLSQASRLIEAVRDAI